MKESFDVVISFEVTEHIPSEKRNNFLSEASRVLEKSLFIISTLNRRLTSSVSSCGKSLIPHFHYIELSPTRFNEILHGYFQNEKDMISEMANDKLISVIIVTRDREKLLLRCLEYVYMQDYPNFEVIVIDDNSTYKISESVAAQFPKARVYRNESHKGLIYSRDKGTKLANGEILFFIDDDAVIENEDILSEGTRILEKRNDIACISLRISDYLNRNSNNTPFSKRDKKRRSHMFERFEVTSFLGTAHFIRKKAFLKCGGYLDMDIFGGEELDLSYRFIKQGYEIYYAGDLVAYHGPIAEAPDHFAYRPRIRSCFCNSFIIAARYLPFPYFFTHTLIWTLYYLYQYHKKKLLINFGKDFSYALQNFMQIWRSERSKHKLDKITVNKIRRLNGRLAY